MLQGFLPFILIRNVPASQGGWSFRVLVLQGTPLFLLHTTRHFLSPETLTIWAESRSIAE